MIYLYKEIKTLKNTCPVCLIWRLRQKFLCTWSPVRRPLLLNDLKCNGPDTAQPVLTCRATYLYKFYLYLYQHYIILSSKKDAQIYLGTSGRQ